MDDEQFLNALESCELPPAEFGHLAHVRAAYLYLLRYDFPEALFRMSRSIKAYAEHLGKTGLYHQTITVASLALIQEHIAERGDAGSWTEFERRNPELKQRDLLMRFYPPSVLASRTARQVFLLPRPEYDADGWRPSSS